MGLFHVKMACADALWRLLILPRFAKNDSDRYSLLHHAEIIRRKESKKIQTKPGFRLMHELILRIGLGSRLDIWRVLVKSLDSSWGSLELFAQSKPSFNLLVSLSHRLAKEYVAKGDMIANLRQKPDSERDMVRENMLLRQQLFSLYEEISYAMNTGDIGRVESTFVPWSYIFSATNKHRYALHLRRYLRDVHLRYPPGLRRAIRMNILINPTGKPGRFRGVDWQVEHNNLFVQRVYGGRFSNHTKHYIIKESSLLGVFKNARMQVDRQFRIAGHGTKHAPPNLDSTIQLLREDLEQTRAHEIVVSRHVQYKIEDSIKTGINISQTSLAALPLRGEGRALIADTDDDPDEDEEEDDWDDQEAVHDEEEEVQDEDDLNEDGFD
ncbi:hypothetical protein MIND_00910600 [Mycena indigotica]|uniref:DUF6589 domain-containing protein n=1 Tax=Mycena indigotica TaxID=2126181 RepID=A0A8H6SC26_9AGAR|nr:uncharacterized protein MIND_00910600 [Mycena indigotica]KAF7296796.1 hypothetical protein MIND_00910600 [Mycena indigotica]